MFLLLVGVLALASAPSATAVAPEEFSILDYGTHVRLNDLQSYEGNKPVESVTAAGFSVLCYGIERTPSTEAAVRSRIKLQDGRGRCTYIYGKKIYMYEFISFSSTVTLLDDLWVYQGNKPVQSVTAAGFSVLDYGIERTPSTEAAARSRIRLQDGRSSVAADCINRSSVLLRLTSRAKATTAGHRTLSTLFLSRETAGQQVRCGNLVINKSKISLMGTSASSTIVTLSAKWASCESATLCVWDSDFVARDITFQVYLIDLLQRLALAAQVSGDRAAFYGCRFLSYQDTILDDKGRHYYTDCYVEGATDFIFGPGKAFFKKCHLHSISMENGSVTAHGREADSDNTGFSFVDCNLTGVGVRTSILGRPWHPCARVAFARCNMSNTVNPVGWTNWNNTNEPSRTAFFGQFQCYGHGSRTETRVKWAHNYLSPAEAKPFLTKQAWVDGQEWIN
ncbi:putative pectinesterase 11 [Dichanthelium oligosanthes]|uniref:Pectinesterase n=1 Tax=Dichanthelium oligosanthes TaxID=888268 RepID=A0A1E5WBW0_9POAL|nr:putative pectinesterase 11 [Dichanthelium oligosanthes]